MAFLTGQISATEDELYSPVVVVTSGKKVRINLFTIHNTSSTDQTVLIYILRAGSEETSKVLRRYFLCERESADVVSELNELTLDRGDSIRAETTTADTVDYLIDREIIE